MRLHEAPVGNRRNCSVRANRALQLAGEYLAGCMLASALHIKSQNIIQLQHGNIMQRIKMLRLMLGILGHTRAAVNNP